MENKKSFTYRKYRENKDRVWLLTGMLLIFTLFVGYLIVTNYKSPWSIGISIFAFFVLIVISSFNKLLDKYSRRNYRT